jgi:hypothetical protein
MTTIACSDGREVHAGEPVMEYFKLDKTKLPLLFGFQVEPDQRKFKCAYELRCLNSAWLLSAQEL